MGIRKIGRWIRGTIVGSRHKPVYQDTVNLPDLIDWFLKNKDAKAIGVIAFSFIYKPPGRPPIRLDDLPDVGEAVPGSIIVQGFYQQESQQVLQHRTIHATQIDDEVAESHAGKDMVVYQ